MPSQGKLIQSFWRVLNLAKLQSSARLFSLRRKITLFLSHCFGVETRGTLVLMIKVIGMKGALRNFLSLPVFLLGLGSPTSRQFVLTRPMKATRFFGRGRNHPDSSAVDRP